jgi:hypothetical protein
MCVVLSIVLSIGKPLYGTTVSRSITFFFWESDLLEKGANRSQINVIIGLLMTHFYWFWFVHDPWAERFFWNRLKPPEFSVVLKQVEGM